MSDAALELAIASVPAGWWAVGVSGGADSVALLSLLRTRADLRLHVAHLNHQTRGAASDADAEFVRQLAVTWGLPCTIALRRDVETLVSKLPVNPSARYRIARLALFRHVIAEHQLSGVILGHHADDQAETILHRLIRGSGPRGLRGMSSQVSLGGTIILRPLLGTARQELRQYLWRIGQGWREDESNLSDRYVRNRLRRLLAQHPPLRAAILNLGECCRSLQRWVDDRAPALGETFPAALLQNQPEILAQESARHWLMARGAPAGELSTAVLDRLIEMSCDAATAPRQQFPGGVRVHRRRGRMFAE